MNKVILFLVVILGILIYLYTTKQENLNQSPLVQSSSNIWNVGETLNVGDVKSSPNGIYKFVQTNNGLTIYSSAFSQNCMFDNNSDCASNQYNYGSSVILKPHGLYFKTYNMTLPFQYSKTKMNDIEYFYISSGYMKSNYLFDLKGNYVGLFGINGASGGSYNGNNIDHIQLTNKGIFGFDKNNNLLFVT